MLQRIDYKTLAAMILALVLGLAWATYNLNLAGAVRSDATVRPLIWAVFAGPFALFVGWLIARRHELALAAACCFGLYFFSFFVAQRIETLLVDPQQITASGHAFYFQTMLVLHALVGVALTTWRALR
ncbi:hypothetical protein OSCT_1981 [Oscillochloris trichoides DG-6]|uniref:Transmembrane protein n=1 Tax=Oscillochloris trichoides DG-6 TaxID=765420 RepID=E1IF80_9CHLR|nr:hypothetical protein [Oscillochloris trichoides]EFO80179.1 hypothetical protein OSCT_1981 [Oscillochloris trichoides DG-6]